MLDFVSEDKQGMVKISWRAMPSGGEARSLQVNIKVFTEYFADVGTKALAEDGTGGSCSVLTGKQKMPK